MLCEVHDVTGIPRYGLTHSHAQTVPWSLRGRTRLKLAFSTHCKSFITYKRMVRTFPSVEDVTQRVDLFSQTFTSNSVPEFLLTFAPLNHGTERERHRDRVTKAETETETHTDKHRGRLDKHRQTEAR